MRSSIVLEHAEIFLSEPPACEDCVEDVLIEEVERIVRRAVAQHRAAHVDETLSALPLIEELWGDGGRDNQKAAVHVCLAPQRPETEAVAPFRVEAVRKRVG